MIVFIGNALSLMIGMCPVRVHLHSRGLSEKLLQVGRPYFLNSCTMSRCGLLKVGLLAPGFCCLIHGIPAQRPR